MRDRSHIVHPGYQRTSRYSAPLERSAPIRIDWFHVILRALMIGATVGVIVFMFASSGTDHSVSQHSAKPFEDRPGGKVGL